MKFTSVITQDLIFPVIMQDFCEDAVWKEVEMVNGYHTDALEEELEKGFVEVFHIVRDGFLYRVVSYKERNHSDRFSIRAERWFVEEAEGQVIQDGMKVVCPDELNYILREVIAEDDAAYRPQTFNFKIAA